MGLMCNVDENQPVPDITVGTEPAPVLARRSFVPPPYVAPRAPIVAPQVVPASPLRFTRPLVTTAPQPAPVQYLAPQPQITKVVEAPAPVRTI